jgi:hypothetical protein
VPKRNREAAETLKMIDLGLEGMNQYTSWLQSNYGASVSLDMRWKTMESYGKQAQQDRRAIEEFIGRKTLTANERGQLERMKQTWRQAMAQPLLWGKDLERDLIDYMEQNQGSSSGAVVSRNPTPSRRCSRPVSTWSTRMRCRVSAPGSSRPSTT